MSFFIKLISGDINFFIIPIFISGKYIGQYKLVFIKVYVNVWSMHSFYTGKKCRLAAMGKMFASMITL